MRVTVPVFSLSPDLEVETEARWTRIRRFHREVKADPSDILVSVVDALASGPIAEADLSSRVSRRETADGEIERALYTLERNGMLVRGVRVEGRQVLEVRPLRPPVGGPSSTGSGRPTLRQGTIATWSPEGLDVHTPGSWASVRLSDSGILEWLGLFESAHPPGERLTLSPEDVNLIVGLLRWCDLLDEGDASPAVDDGVDWAPHELLFHTRTRWGFRDQPLGKTHPLGMAALHHRPDRRSSRPAGVQLPREDPRENPDFWSIAQTRRSSRDFGDRPMSWDELGSLIHAVFGNQGGRRAYPSGGGLYALEAYPLVRRCDGLDPGVYDYDPSENRLRPVSGPGPVLDRLFDDAARAMSVASPPPVLIVLAARPDTVRACYGDLAYPLLLKEVGAVQQLAGMAATALGLACCPLGCGDSRLFAEVCAEDPLHFLSVGEFCIGPRSESG